MKIRSHSESHLVELEDGSRWQIFPGGLDLTLGWTPETDLLVVEAAKDDLGSHLLVGVGEKVRVIPEARAGPSARPRRPQRRLNRSRFAGAGEDHGGRHRLGRGGCPDALRAGLALEIVPPGQFEQSAPLAAHLLTATVQVRYSPFGPSATSALRGRGPLPGDGPTKGMLAAEGSL